MKVSIALASYNGAPFIEKQLDSFLCQTHLPDEVVVSDDGSTDDTLKIVDEFAKKAPFKVLFCKNTGNHGYAGNFNNALLKVSGDLVFLSDQDDVWFPEKIEYHKNLAEYNENMSLFMTDAELTNENLESVGITKIEQICSSGLSIKRFVMGCCCSIRKELLDLIIPIPIGYKAHDNWIVRFADEFNVKFIDRRVLQYYRRHQNNESNFIINDLKKVSRYRFMLHQLKNYMSNDLICSDLRAIEYEKMILSAAKKSLNKNDAYNKRILIMIDDVSRRILFMEKRIEIRKMNLFLRISNTLMMLLKNKDGYDSIMKDIIRDITRPIKSDI